VSDGKASGQELNQAIIEIRCNSGNLDQLGTSADLSALGSEAEGQVLGAAGGVAIHQGTEADLVEDAEACEAFDHHADQQAHHGRAAVDQFNPAELGEVYLTVIGLIGLAADPGGLGGGGLGHGIAATLRFLTHLRPFRRSSLVMG
jgi:hypothetical protein